MGKTVVVISKQRDLIKNDINKVIKWLSDGETYIKKKVDNKSFARVDLDASKLGLLWFVSEDYSNFIKNTQFFVDYAKDKCKMAFEFNLRNVNDETINRAITQAAEIEKAVGKCHMYLKLNLAFLNNLEAHFQEVLEAIFSTAAESQAEISRIQADFSGVTLSKSKQVEIADTLAALASKFRIPVASCRSELFNEKNIWISNEPCVSGNIMRDILGVKMITVRAISPSHEHCMCHKHVDILGSGEEFNGDMSLVRESDRPAELKKITSSEGSKVSKPKEPKDTKPKSTKKSEGTPAKTTKPKAPSSPKASKKDKEQAKLDKVLEIL